MDFDSLNNDVVDSTILSLVRIGEQRVLTFDVSACRERMTRHPRRLRHAPEQGAKRHSLNTSGKS